MQKKRIIYFSCLYFLLLFFISGCGQKVDDENEDWKDEVMMAHECGLEGFACCADKEPACQYGLSCCTDPNNIKINMCVPNCACGGEGRFCCKSEPLCDSGLACFKGLCATCGEKDQPCCPHTGCGKDLACQAGQCVLCGLSGHPCCPDEPKCVNQATDDPDRAECQGGICAPCGTAGEPACPGEPACGTKHLLNNNICYKCGDFNQPCCADDFISEGGCDPTGDLECSLGFCRKK